MKELFGLLFSHALIFWLPLGAWWLYGVEWAGNLFLFFAWTVSLGRVVTALMEDGKAKKPLPKWLRPLADGLWLALVVCMAGDGRFVLAIVMLFGIGATLAIRERADKAGAALHGEAN